ncbi:MAG: group 1 truncated hemoglobin [Myxococcota bacterium]|nr:group 1 truncated hemoglobin [Myxococcota bacterium]
MTLYDTIGGEDVLRAILRDFYDRVFVDPMIGYMFHGRDKAHLVEREVEFTARLLGADVVYQGRSMAKAHRQHHIARGHFARRLVLLEQTLDDHQVDESVRQCWIDHTRALASVVMGPSASADDCDPPASAEMPMGLKVYKP